jgi:hypothetical protein
MQADCGYAMKLARSAADKLKDIAGPGSFALNNAMQRHAAPVAQFKRRQSSQCA